MGFSKYISVEFRMQEMFNYLPEMQGISIGSTELFKPVFGYGDEKQLNFFLTERSHMVNYPLIWLLYPYKERHTLKYVDLNSISLILAVESIPGLSNKERMDQTYSKVLNLLYNNILELFMKSNIIKVDKYYDVIKYPNYGEANALRTQEESLSVDIWDAMKVTFNCQISSNCLNPIKFN